MHIKEFRVQGAIHKDVKAGKKMLVQFKVSDRFEHQCSNTITQCEVQINVLK